ncbi:MAG TPA: spore coat associated protein CotJA [Candidatus Merdivicinus excrementipullorum]|uniref:Spore coat associated protein CotJA n=1 Tax=Candidatus Merdivicinus excrementipullorum TaxID=2840867 RepID=A0A9D1FPF9_9FIRM|nr:spore coat associated protein CotJA [Candidatus Merdivicinus excrementipullorum]HIV19940.1 spore coat associated protein CotJA [Candidatus Merdivicinus intestinigallinarum]
MEQNESCQCLDSLPLAMAYVPMQKWKETYAPATAIDRGTIFPELDLPFIGEEAVKNG